MMVIGLLAPIALTVGLLLKYGTRLGVQKSWFIVLFLLPSAIALGSSDFAISLPVICAAVGLAAFVARKADTGTFAPTPIDFACHSLFLCVLLANFFVGELTLESTTHLLTLWALPYLAGRFFFSPIDGPRQLLPTICRIATVIFALVLFEAMTRINIVQLAWQLPMKEYYRWGLRRASIGFLHPANLGLALVMLHAWMLVAREYSRGEGPRWWRFLPWANFAAVVCTGSIPAILGCLIASGIYVFLRRPQLRVGLLAAAVVLGGLLVAVKVPLVRWVDQNLLASKATTVTIAGKEYVHTRGRHPILTDIVYADIVKSATPFGYGTALSGVEIEPQLVGTFGRVHDHYLKFRLQYGVAGLSAFLAAYVASFASMCFLAWRADRPQAEFYAGVAASMIGFTVVLRSINLADEVQVVWLFMAGMAACFFNLRKHVQPPTERGPAVDQGTELQNRQNAVSELQTSP